VRLPGPTLLLAVALPIAAHAQTPPPAAPAPDTASAAAPVPALDIDVVAQQLDAARSQIQPSLGASRYDFDPSALQAIPQGDNAPLNQVLLQAPGVAQDSFGQIHIRGDHANVQYRLDGVQLPEGLSGFGQALESRFAHALSLITGALPAQYGFQQAGIVDIVTRSGTTDPGAELSAYGGMRAYAQPSGAWGGRSGPFDWYVTGDFLHDRIGIENPAATFDALHDTTNQYHGFAHLSWIVDDETRVSLLAGAYSGSFQIPDNPGQVPTFSASGTTRFNSSTLNENQTETTRIGIVSLQKHLATLDLQIAAFTRASTLAFTPDPLGDLIFTGVAQNAQRSSWANGIQSDFTVYDGSGKTGFLYGIYLQDEWTLLPSLTLNYGARFDAVDAYTQQNQLSPRINLVWKPRDGTTLNLGYARYFTPPPFELVSSTTIARFANTSAAPEISLDSPVRAESDQYFDAGARQRLAPDLTIGVDAYYKLAHDLIDEGQFGASIILTPFNYAQGEVGGIELTASYDRGPLSLYANYAYSRAIGKDIVSSQFNFSADELAYIAQRWIYLDHNQTSTGSAGAAYTVFAGTPEPLRLSADLVAGSGLRASTATVPNGAALPSYVTLNLSGVQTLATGTELRLDVINLLDHVYQIRNGTGVGVGAPQYGQRLTVLAGIAQRF
jgi:outer membrane receptor protein involved in Fe transport